MKPLTPAMLHALRYVARCQDDSDYGLQAHVARPKSGTYVALIERGLITPMTAATHHQHRLTDAGWDEAERQWPDEFGVDE
jgi:hypothetical protein